jgi:5-methylcytosine-specific restriction protein A
VPMPTRPGSHTLSLAYGRRMEAEVDRRPSAHRRGYGKRWQAAAHAWLRAHPLCMTCEARGVVRAATQVDHRLAAQPGSVLFWDPGNWQGLCAGCHARKTAREDGGFGNPRV